METFFRRWPLYLLLLVLFGSMGVWTVASQEQTYRSTGTLAVAGDTLLASLSNVQDNPNYGWETPASSTSRQLAAQLQTDRFLSSVAASAGLTSDVAAGTTTLDDLRQSIGVWDAGSNLIKVSAATPDPAHAPKLVKAVVDEFTSYLVTSQTTDSTAAEEFYSDLSEEYQRQVDEARGALEAFLLANPNLSAAEEDRLESQEIELERLRTNFERAEERFESAVANVQAAQLAQRQAIADVSQRLTVIDQPESAYAEGRLRKSAMTVVAFLVMGALLAAGAVTGAMLLDRTVRSGTELTDRLGVPVLAELPSVRSPRIERLDIDTVPRPRSSDQSGFHPPAEADAHAPVVKLSNRSTAPTTESAGGSRAEPSERVAR